MKHILTIALALVVTGTLAVAQNGPSPETLFKAAQHAEEVQGDLKAAIEQYKRVIDAGNRALAAQALLRMADCYQKLGDAQARKIYEQIVREYADQKEVVVIAQARLGRAAQTARQGGITLRRVWDGDASGLPAAVLTTVSQDGRRLTYSPGATGSVAVHDLATGTDRRLTLSDFLAGPTAISKDGTQVAYEWYGGEHGSELRLLRIEGTGVPPFRRLYENADIAQITPMDFSPDGTSIAVTLVRKDRTKQIGLVTVQSGTLRVLKSVDWRGPTRIFFSPDGHDLAFDLPANDSTDQHDVFVLAVDGSREAAAVVHPSNDIVMGWSPDGTHLLFASDRRGGAMGLWALAFAKGKPQGAPELIKESIGTAWSLGVTRSGALYLGVGAGNRDIAVVSVDLTTGKQINSPVRPIQSFIGSNLQPAWSPDGKFLAYASMRSYSPIFADRRILAIRSVDTGEVRELRPSLTYFDQMSWAPDGRALATGGTDLKGREGIFRVDAHTGEVVPIVLSQDGAKSFPQWSPDGQRIYYRRPSVNGVVGGQVAFVEREMASGQEREIIRGSLGSINLSPDGRSIVTSSTDAKTSAVLLIHVDTGEPRELLRVSQPQGILQLTGMPWTPDGRGVIVRKRVTADTFELWLVPIADAAARKLDIDVNDWATGNRGVISLHPDGRQIAFLTGQGSAEVWVLENFLPTLKASR